MMFPWNIAKSAVETMFARFAVKRLCKFLLKKKLGQFLLGEIDLDQLDVQLRAGTIQLSDLALNVDYLNLKLDKGASLQVREGSIGSLLIKMPWNGEGCAIEVDALEVVLSPLYDDRVHVEGRTCHSSNASSVDDEIQKTVNNIYYKTATTSGADVHEGVKAVAKMVKWLLTTFHVRVKKVIVVLDPHMEKHENGGVCHKTLVFRITEIECGTCVGEDADQIGESKVEDILGISHLTNFLKFQGATVEILEVDGADKFSTVTVLTGNKDGVSGNVKLSIPWKNGTLNVLKVDANISVDPVKVILHPGMIRWFLLLWEILGNMENSGKVGDNKCNMLPTHSELSPFLRPNDDSGIIPNKLYAGETIFQGSHVISDWVPLPVSNCQKGDIDEADLGASMDQFFECFDGLRSSQSLFSSSGMWNWTCSVFGAITAASNIASGSLHAPAEQQHAETNVKVMLLGVSTTLSFVDEDQMMLDSSVRAENADSSHYLESTWQGISIEMQVSPQERKFEATVDHIDLYDCIRARNDADDSKRCGQNSEMSQTLIVQRLQAAVQGSLPSRSFSSVGSGTSRNRECKDGEELRVNLLNTSGVGRFRFASSSDSCFLGLVSFSLQLPPFLFWLNFGLVDMLSSLLKKTLSPSGVNDPAKQVSPEVFDTKCGKRLKADIFVSNARVMLCFPLKSGGVSTYTSWDQFVALDFSFPDKCKEKKAEAAFVSHECAFGKEVYTSLASLSWHWNIRHADTYLITSDSNGDNDIPQDLKRQRFCAQRILSLSSRDSYLPVISILWDDTAVTGASIFSFAKLLASADGSGISNSFREQGFEFASATKRNDTDDLNSEKQRKIISSSKVSIHVRLSSATVGFHRSQYTVLVRLLKQVMERLSLVGSDCNDSKERDAIQTSVVVDVDTLEIVIELNAEDSCSQSLQSEMPGMWHYMKLDVKKLELLSVSNIGGVCAANFFWMTHGEGKLLGSISGLSNQEVLLISCCNSALGRGDGEGSNALSRRLGGSNVVHLWDPESSHDIMSITVKCVTIVAPGGRLDWLERVISFFCLSSHESEEAADTVELIQKPSGSLPAESSFSLIFVDAGLSYEPYIKKIVDSPYCSTASTGEFAHAGEETSKSRVACLLAASCLKLCSSTVSGAVNYEYNIMVQDLGILLHSLSKSASFIRDYGAENLRKVGYVKVAGEAHVVLILRISCEKEQFWELNCSESHIVLNTCRDTTVGLLHLATQIQQLLSPDMEESTAHLQNRWNSNRQTIGRNNFDGEGDNCDLPPCTSMGKQETSVGENENAIDGLMNEICEDVFSFQGKYVKSYHWAERESKDPVNQTEGEDFESALRSPKNFAVVPKGLMESEGPEFVEGSYLSGLKSLSELTLSNHFSCESNSAILGGSAVQRANSGWFSDASLNIVENHISHITKDSDLKPEKFKGRIVLSNIKVNWHMYAGSDWHGLVKDVELAGDSRGRDQTQCLEVALSDMHVQFDIFPDGSMCVSKIRLSVKDIYLYDRSRCAPWDLVLRDYNSKQHPRGSSSKAFKLELEAVRPDPSTPLEEYRLRVAFMPLSLYLHQSQLDFLISFFGEPSADDLDSDEVYSSSNTKRTAISEEALLPFFQKFDVWPSTVRMEYRPSHVDLAALSGGRYVELVNLVPWKGVELELKHLQATGVYGWSNVCETILGEWLEDISQNQIHKVLRGLPPFQSMVSVGSGAAKLVSLPVKSYRKDHRLVKGLQRGTIAFLRSISVETLGLGAHLAAEAEDILLHTECALNRIGSSRKHQRRMMAKRNITNQPKDAQHGLQQACERLTDGFGRSASALLHHPMKSYQRGNGAGSAFVSAVKGAPVAAIAPTSAFLQAFQCALLGVKNSINPGEMEETMSKYVGPRPSLP